jgi:hypothetical protein
MSTFVPDAATRLLDAGDACGAFRVAARARLPRNRRQRDSASVQSVSASRISPVTQMSRFGAHEARAPAAVTGGAGRRYFRLSSMVATPSLAVVECGVPAKPHRLSRMAARTAVDHAGHPAQIGRRDVARFDHAAIDLQNAS